MKLKPKGRVPSLLAWGLLVGGVALLMTFPGGVAPAETLGFRELPAAILYILAVLIFGLSHPEGRTWMGAPLLGWVPLLVGPVLATDGSPPRAGLWLGIMILPGLLAAAGAWAGAAIARRRSGGL
jgi:hypothetical protein